MTELLNLLFGIVRSFLRRDTDLLLENLALHHQLQVVLDPSREHAYEVGTGFCWSGSVDFVLVHGTATSSW